MTHRQSGTVEFGETTIPFEFKRSETRHTIAISVHPDGAVTVDAPKGTRRNQIRDAVREKRVWIINQQEHFRRLAKRRLKRFVSGESFLYLGRQYRLQILSASETSLPSVRLFRGHLEVRIPDNLAQERQASTIRDLVVGWYREKASGRLKLLSERYARQLGVSIDSIRIREMQRRWGSARHTGTITFNWKIILAPKRLVEYVVAHEVCHLRYDDHSKEFWRLLERVMPDFERRRKDLAIQGGRLELEIEEREPVAMRGSDTKRCRQTNSKKHLK